MYYNNSKKMKRGLGLADVVLGVILSMGAYQTYTENAEQTQDSVIADSISSTMKDIQAVGKQWIRDNSTQALNSMSDNQIIAVPITGNMGPIIGTKALYGTGNVPGNYSANLPESQKMAYLIRKVPATATVPTHLESIITSYGGLAYSNRLLGMTAERLGVTGGAVMGQLYKKRYSVPGKIQGTYGSWNYPQGVWNASGSGGDDYTPKSGHIVMIGSQYGNLTNQYLNRYATSDPEANRMHTDMDVNNNTINTVNTVNGVPNANLNLGTISGNNVVMPNNLTVCDFTKVNCGVRIVSTTLTNDNNGWTTLSSPNSGLYINGSEVPGFRSQSALYTGVPNGSESAFPSGVIFNANSGGAFGSHLYQENSQFLALSGNNGFSGLSIQPQSSSHADIVLLSSRIYGDRSTNTTIELPSGAATLGITHLDGSLNSFAANALNLGTSSDASQNGNSYPAYITTTGTAIVGGPCAPTGRIATSTDNQGLFLSCMNGKWYNQTKSAFSNLVYQGSGWNYTANNTDYAQIITTVFDADDRARYTRYNPDWTVYVNGSVVCRDINDQDDSGHNSGGQHGSYTCTAVLPPHSTISYSGSFGMFECSRHHHHRCWGIGTAGLWSYVYSSQPM